MSLASDWLALATYDEVRRKARVELIARFVMVRCLGVLLALLQATAATESFMFDSTTSFCRYYCSHFSVRQRLDCNTATCASVMDRRHLTQEDSTPSLDLLACGASNLHLNMSDQGAAFHGFWDQFQASVNSVVDGSTPSFHTCDLALPTPPAPLLASTTATATPILVQLVRSNDEHECIPQIQVLLPAISSDLSLLSRSNGIDQGL
ncbi:Aste57867_3056 [Aphanomyces stellatus]|uniref:Aste57867_3056 protein n=1 Tax=Aphanomyces stellatus TaxID=120398 RepID=A0A485KCP6_9STRA|nr:hypothetical protein As57867_003047 [Aphanomyces stellatus]VFT80236.1 Aste57867_3056 [Aphanomyces stellatus]